MSKLKLIIRELINLTINTSAIYDSVAVHDNNGTVYNNNATIHNEGRHSAWSRSMKIYLWNRQILCVSVYIKDLSLVSHSNFVERKKKTAVDNGDRGRASPSNPKVREQSLNSWNHLLSRQPYRWSHFSPFSFRFFRDIISP